MVNLAEINLEKNEDVQDIDDIITPEEYSAGISININLLGYEAREEIEKNLSGLKISKAVLLSIGVISLSILINVVALLVITDLRDGEKVKKEQLEARKAELDRKKQEYEGLVKQRDVVKQKRDILEWAVNKNYKWSSLLEEVRNRTPGNLWVNSVNIDASYNLSIVGETFDYKTVAMFLANLQSSASFKNVVLINTSKEPGIKYSQIEAALKNPQKENNDIADINIERVVRSSTKFTIRCQVVVNI